MGYNYIPWVSDMLDLSGGCGSWNLSMNQGLAHLQATAYMNSCWTCSCSFSPYSSMGTGLDYLLDPSFAMWQTANGISSSNNIWGNNFGNFGNLFTNPWQTPTTVCYHRSRKCFRTRQHLMLLHRYHPNLVPCSTRIQKAVFH